MKSKKFVSNGKGVNKICWSFTIKNLKRSFLFQKRILVRITFLKDRISKNGLRIVQIFWEIISTEYDRFDKTNERLDLLAIDKDGNLVVTELNVMIPQIC